MRDAAQPPNALLAGRNTGTSRDAATRDTEQIDAFAVDVCFVLNRRVIIGLDITPQTSYSEELMVGLVWRISTKHANTSHQTCI